MRAGFTAIPELVRLLADHVADRQDIRNLTLVNRLFHDIFSPKLWATLQWDAKNLALWLNEEKRCHYVQSQHMAHVEAIIQTCPNDDVHPSEHEGEWVGKTSQALADTVRHCVKLCRFEVRQTIVGHDLMKSLTDQEHLMELHLEFRVNMEELLFAEMNWPPPDAREAIMRYCGHPEKYLNRFKHLKCLDLRNIWGDMQSWRECLLETLLSCPQLEHLELSIDNEARKRLEYECGDVSTSVLSWICQAYGIRRTRANHPAETENQIPLLRLRSLFLGEGFRFPDHGDLCQATDLKEMTVVYVYNDTYGGDLGNGGIYWFNWDVLSYESMPDLQYIFVHSLDMDAWENLPSVVSSHFNAGGNLVGFAAYEDRFSEERDEDPDVPSMLELCNRTAPLSMISLPITLTEEEIRLDLQLLRNCTWLTHLSLSFAENNAEGKGRNSPLVLIIRDTLASLVNLQAFQAPLLAYSGHGNENLGDIALALAEDCPALRYISLHGKRWRVRRNDVSQGPSTVQGLQVSEDKVDVPQFFRGPRFLML